jgi:hypothetical protein
LDALAVQAITGAFRALDRPGPRDDVAAALAVFPPDEGDLAGVARTFDRAGEGSAELVLAHPEWLGQPSMIDGYIVEVLVEFPMEFHGQACTWGWAQAAETLGEQSAELCGRRCPGCGSLFAAFGQAMKAELNVLGFGHEWSWVSLSKLAALGY